MSYAWRDPARVTPARLAELQARDRRAAALQPPSAAGGRRQNGGRDQAAARAAAVAEFAALRDAGLTVAEAAAAMSVSRKTGRSYERARLRLKSGDSA